MQDLFRKMKRDIDKEAFISSINTVASIIFFLNKYIFYSFSWMYNWKK